jgi:hypothetical protein
VESLAGGSMAPMDLPPPQCACVLQQKASPLQRKTSRPKSEIERGDRCASTFDFGSRLQNSGRFP